MNKDNEAASLLGAAGVQGEDLRGAVRSVNALGNESPVHAADLLGIMESDGRSVQEIMDHIRGDR